MHCFAILLEKKAYLLPRINMLYDGILLDRKKWTYERLYRVY